MDERAYRRMIWGCSCGHVARSATAEARHRHNFPLLCRRPRQPRKRKERDMTQYFVDHSSGVYVGRGSDGRPRFDNSSLRLPAAAPVWDTPEEAAAEIASWPESNRHGARPRRVRPHHERRVR